MPPLNDLATRPNWRAWVAILLALIAIALFVDRRRPPPAAEPLTPPAAVAAATAPTAFPTPTAFAPLPLPDAPLLEIVTDLQQRADAGDTLAACRLGMELLRCQHLDSVGVELESVAMESQSMGVDGMLHATAPLPDAGNRERFLQIGFQCAALPAAQRARGNHYLRQAALAGEIEALLRYARGESLPLTGSWDQLRDPAFLQWRHEAPLLLQRALASGRAEVLDELIAALQPGSPPLSLGAVIADDPERLYAYRLLRARLRGESADPADVATPPGLDNGGRTRAAALAERLHREDFGGRVDAAAEWQLPPLLPAPDDPRPASDAVEFCGRGAGR